MDDGRSCVISAFEGPGIDPPSLDDRDTPSGGICQNKDVMPKRAISAAVLVPLIDRGGGMTVLLTQRTSHLNSHAGQISFPGGKTEDDDSSPEETALRESKEEIGLPLDQVEILGRLGQRTTGSGFQVTPVVGLISGSVRFVANPSEVAEIFEMPLSFVIDSANHKIETRLIEGLERKFYVLPYNGYYIWGLTARLLVALGNTLKQT